MKNRRFVTQQGQLQSRFYSKARGPFLERPGNFSGPKANFEIKTCWIVAQFLAHKPVNSASLTDTFIVSFSRLLKLMVSLIANTANIKELFGSEKVIGSFEKRAPGHWESKQHNLVSLYTTFEKLLIKIKWLRHSQKRKDKKRKI